MQPVDLAQDALADAARRRPAHPAVIVLDAAGAEVAVQTWAALDVAVERVARGLALRGVEAGDRVAVWTPDATVALHAMFACDRRQAVFAPLHAALSPAEADDRVARLGARVRIEGGDDLAPGPDPVRDAVGVASGVDGGARRAGLPMPPAGDAAWATVLAQWGADGGPAPGLGAAPGAATDALGRDAWVLFTSGTTGRAKAAVLTRANLVASAMASALRLGVDPADRWLACMPLYHVGGLSILWRSAWMGTSVVALPRFTVAGVARALAEQRITLLSVVPTMLVRLLRAGVAPGPSLRAVLVGGGPSTPALLREARGAGWPVCPTWGLTEAASQVATLSADAPDEALATVGAPLDGTRVRVARPGPDGIGELEVRGPTVMRGYLDEPADAAPALVDGWLRSGDLGRVVDGRIVIASRRTDLILTGGENVYPAEVEAALQGVAEAESVLVVGVPDEEWGQQVACLVVAAPGASDAVVDALQRAARARLGPHQRPRRYVVVDALPVNGVGKLDRRAAAAQARAATRLDGAAPRA